MRATSPLTNERRPQLARAADGNTIRITKSPTATVAHERRPRQAAVTSPMAGSRDREADNVRSGVEMLFPQAVEAEEGVLGSLLIAPDAMAAIAPVLRPDDFCREAHQHIFEAALALHNASTPVDLITLTDELARRGTLEAAWGASYVSSLANLVPTSANAAHYARIVALTATQRRLIHAAEQIAAAAYARQEGALEQAERTLEDIRARATYKDAARRERFRFLDDDAVVDLTPATGIVGDILFEDSLAFLYAREGRWKTFLALDWALSCATGRSWQGRLVKAGPAVFIAAEGARGIGKRIAAWKAHHHLVGVRTQLKVLGAAVQLLDAGEVRDLIESIRAQVGQPVLIVVDTLARSMVGGDENSAKDINTVTAAATAIQQAFGCCVLIVHHGGKNELLGMRGSSALRSNPDTVIRISGKDAEPKIAPGDPIAVICEKSKDDTPFEAITLTARVVDVPNEDGGSEYSSLVLVPIDSSTAPAPDLTANQRKALDTLYQAPGGMRTQEWRIATDLAERTFFGVLTLLVAKAYVAKETKSHTYRVTSLGEHLVDASLRQPAAKSGANGTAGEAETPDISPDGDHEHDGQVAAATAKPHRVRSCSSSSPDGTIDPMAPPAGFLDRRVRELAAEGITGDAAVQQALREKANLWPAP